MPFLFKLGNFNEKDLEKFKKIIHDHHSILKENDEFIKDFKTAKKDAHFDQKYWDLREKTFSQYFWQNSDTLNKRLIEYLKEFDENVFDFARYFLIGSYSDAKMKTKCHESITKFYHDLGLEVENLTIEQKQIVFYIFNILFDDTILLQELTRKKLEENLKAAFKYTHFNVNDLGKFYDYLHKNYIHRDMKRTVNVKRNHVCLLIDKNLHQIPWECLPISEKQSITRMPSIHF